MPSQFSPWDRASCGFTAEQISHLSRLEEVIPLMGRSPAIGGQMFVQLCSLVLQEMGFVDIQIRRGSEQGRDIDARYGTTKWFFECKRYSANVDVPKTAYKFLQLEALRDSAKPDFFIVISNAPATSQLRDIISSKSLDESTKYFADIWCQTEIGEGFDDLILSYPNALTTFVQDYLKCGKEVDALVSDFRKRSATHIALRQPFFNKFRATIAPLTKSDVSDSSPIAFIVEQTFLTTCERLSLFHGNIVLVAVPAAPVPKLYDFKNSRNVAAFEDVLARWDVRLRDAYSDCLRFRESFSANTLIFDFGAIALDSDCLCVGKTLAPTQWLFQIRENSLRIRNFAKRGILPTPFYVRAYLISAHPIALGGPEMWGPSEPEAVERYLKSDDESQSAESDHSKSLSLVRARSEILRFDGPPQTHEEIGRAIVDSLGRRAGISEHYCADAKGILESMISGMAEKVTEAGFIENFQALYWLVYGEMRDRSYNVFETYLKNKGPRGQPTA